MVYTDLFHTLVQNARDTRISEFIAVITGILSVWYARRENILVYPVGIVSVLIYVYLCFISGLYADMGINLFYFFMSVYGWYNWTRRDNETHKVIPVSFCTPKQNALFALLTFVLSGIIYAVLSTWTDSTVPVLDSVSTAIFITGMWLMALKKTENWIYWIIGDVLAVFLFSYKGLVFSGFQYIVFLALAISGLIEWWKRSKVNPVI